MRCARVGGMTQRRGYDDLRYPVSIDVRVSWADGLVHFDSIKGLSEGHALYLAWLNWPDAAHIWLVR